MRSPGAALREVVVEELRALVREAVREAIASPQAPSAVAPMRCQPGAYRGDTRAKKAVRLRTWEAIRAALGRRFSTGPHVFLASSDGGDASVLRGLGIPDSAMIAVDFDEEAAMAFHQSYPRVALRVEDVASVLLGLSSPVASAYLDFTSQLSDPVLQRVLMALRAVGPRGVVAFTFAVGREKAGRWDGRAGGACERRIDAALDWLAKELGMPPGDRPLVVRRMAHVSESVDGPGSKMCTLVIRKVPGLEQPPLGRIRAYDLYSDVHRLIGHHNLPLLINCTDEETAQLVDRVTKYPPPGA